MNGGIKVIKESTKAELDKVESGDISNECPITF